MPIKVANGNFDKHMLKVILHTIINTLMMMIREVEQLSFVERLRELLLFGEEKLQGVIIVTFQYLKRSDKKDGGTFYKGLE